MRADFFSNSNEFNKALIVFSQSIIGKLRMIKSDLEIEKLKKSASVADQVMKEALETFTGNDRVSLVQDNLGFHQLGAKPAFSLVASGANGTFPHHHSENMPIQKGLPTIIDIGANVDGYFSDMTNGPSPCPFCEVYAFSWNCRGGFISCYRLCNRRSTC